MITATLWISGRTCRVLVKNGDRTIDMNDDWNNIASAQTAIYESYPEAEQIVIRNDAAIKALNSEWNRCKLGD